MLLIQQAAGGTAMRNESILQVENLSVSFPTENGVLHAVKSLSYEVYKGETFAIVGESGSGARKTT